MKDGKIIRIGGVPPDDFHPPAKNVILKSGEVEVWPIDRDNIERRWNFGLDSINANLERITIQKIDNNFDIFLTHELKVPKTLWSGGEFDAGNYGNTLLINILGTKLFDFPKSINLVKRCIYLATIHSKDSIILDYFAGSGTTGHAVISLNREDGGKRKYVLVEMGDYFDTVLKRRIAKVVYSENWKEGKPTARHTGISHCFKYLRLESYEDTLNNLHLNEKLGKSNLLSNRSLKEDYMLHYLLDVETRGSQSLLNIDQFADPTNYMLRVKKPGSDEYVKRSVDLIETFNYLIGLRISHMAASQTFSASFKRIQDAELPQDQQTKLSVDGCIWEDTMGRWWFRQVEGWVPKNPDNPSDNEREKVLIIWRKLTGDLEQDNLMLDEWFQNRRDIHDLNVDTIYINASNNLPNIKADHEKWTVRLIEEEFFRRMWSTQ